MTPLDAMELVLGAFRVELPLAPQRERVVFNRQLDLLLLHVGQLGLEDQLVLAVAVNVDRRDPRATGDVFLRTAIDALEHPAHLLLLRGHITERIPTNTRHADTPPLRHTPAAAI